MMGNERVIIGENKPIQTDGFNYVPLILSTSEVGNGLENIPVGMIDLESKGPNATERDRYGTARLVGCTGE